MIRKYGVVMCEIFYISLQFMSNDLNVITWFFPAALSLWTKGFFFMGYRDTGGLNGANSYL